MYILINAIKFNIKAVRRSFLHPQCIWYRTHSREISIDSAMLRLRLVITSGAAQETLRRTKQYLHLIGQIQSRKFNSKIAKNQPINCNISDTNPRKLI